MIARYLRNDEDNPIFAYFDSNDDEIIPLPASAGDLQRIAQVTICLTADYDPDRLPEPAVIQTNVFLRNKDQE